jgi:hypothetical protein
MIKDAADPLMKLKGLGKEVWKELGGGDAVIDWLRSDKPTTPPWERGRPARGSCGTPESKRGEV